jgi:hypothetical protein
MFPGYYCAHTAPHTLPVSRRAFIRYRDKNAIHGHQGRDMPIIYHSSPVIIPGFSVICPCKALECVIRAFYALQLYYHSLNYRPSWSILWRYVIFSILLQNCNYFAFLLSKNGEK